MAVITPSPAAWQRTAAELPPVLVRRRAVLDTEPVEAETVLGEGFVPLAAILAAAAHRLAATA